MFKSTLNRNTCIVNKLLVLMLIFFDYWLSCKAHSFLEIAHEIFPTVSRSLPLIKEGQLSVSGVKMCKNTT